MGIMYLGTSRARTDIGTCVWSFVVQGNDFKVKSSLHKPGQLNNRVENSKVLKSALESACSSFTLSDPGERAVILTLYFCLRETPLNGRQQDRNNLRGPWKPPS